MSAPATNAAAGPSLEQLAILKAAKNTLRRTASGWRSAPFSPSRPQAYSSFNVRCLVALGFLEYGGAGWVKLTAKGRKATS